MSKKMKLLDEITQFLEMEKELFGNISIKEPPPAKPADSLQEIPTTPDSRQDMGLEDKLSASRTDDLSTTPFEIEPVAHGEADETHIPPAAPTDVADSLNSCIDLQQLQDLCAGNDSLKTGLKNTNLVFGDGDPNADLMIIGEAPGYHEDQQGVPFVGKAGKLLDKILAAIQFSRSDIYITNILKHRPPDNRDPSREECERNLPWLNRQIELIDPKLILCLGKASAITLLNRQDSLKNMRGKFHPYMGRELMVTYHPAALLRNPKLKRPVWEDVQLLKERYELLTGTV